MTLLPVVALLIMAVGAGCASIGRPEGGPRDVTPPVFVSGTPAEGAINVKTNKIRLTFDENIQLKNVQQTVIVSPAQKMQPLINGNGRNISIELRDSLRDGVTYTIDFGDAITDLNEGNPLDGFAYAFSTGQVIDSLAISGMVMEARTLEPAQGMLVGAYRSEDPDSAILTMPFDRVTRTNQLGQFTLRNLAPGTYRLYALNDRNGDYHWDRSEDVAFLGEAVTPEVQETVFNDSLKAADGTDSVVTIRSAVYLPNDVLLTWFNEDYRPAYMTKYERKEPARMSLLFNAPVDSMPELRIVAPEGPLAALNGRPASEWAAIDASAGRDTLDVWIADSMIIKSDSLLLSARYLMTDTADNLVWATDTIKMFYRPNDKKKKKDNNIIAPLEPSDSASTDSAAAPVKVIPKMGMTIDGGTTHQLNLPLSISIDRPLATFDSTAVKLEVKLEGDSAWNNIDGFTLLRPNPDRLLKLEGSPVEWKSGASYRLTVDSAAMVSIYGEVLPKTVEEFKARNIDEYSAIIFNVEGTAGRHAMAELLNKEDKPVRAVPVVNGRAEFRYLEPATYYARLYFDDNDNGRYDTGLLLDSIQPEETYYYPKRIDLKKNWDVEQNWNITEMPVDLQKHTDIKKNKPKPKPGEEPLKEEEEEQKYDRFGRPIIGSEGQGGYTNPFGGGGGNNRNQTLQNTQR